MWCARTNDLHFPQTAQVINLKPPHTHTHTHAQVQDARIVEVANDRTDTYLQAIRPQITPQLQLVVIVFPTSRDDRLAMADVTPSWNW